MIKFAAHNFCLLTLFALFLSAEGKSVGAANSFDRTNGSKPGISVDAEDEDKKAVAETTRIAAEIINASFPELKNASIKIKTFRSRSDYFRSRFSFGRFLTFRKLDYLIFVNPQAFEKNAPLLGIRAIIAHELAHVAYYRRHNRFELLGLVSLQSKSFTARFERGADLQAIKRGYGEGLRDYRQWLYQNIPASKIAAKKRDYFSPEEIDLILQAAKDKPALIDFWIENVPRDSAEIESAIKSRTPGKK